MATKFVEMKHSKVKKTARVPESSVAHYKKAGWELVTDKSADKVPADKKES